MQSRAGIVAMGVALAVLSAAPADAKKRADLFVTAVGEPPATLVAGTTLTASETVKNRGATAKPSSTAYLLSPDEFRDRSDFVLGARSVKRLKPRWSAAGRAQVTVPTVVPAGAYRLLACADAESQVRERSERNNCRASNGSVQVVGSAPAPGSPPPGVPAVDSVAPPPPSITATAPASPADDTNPEVTGSAEAGSTVTVYGSIDGSADCAAPELATGSAAQFAVPGITVPMQENGHHAARPRPTPPATSRPARRRSTTPRFHLHELEHRSASGLEDEPGARHARPIREFRELTQARAACPGTTP